MLTLNNDACQIIGLSTYFTFNTKPQLVYCSAHKITNTTDCRLPAFAVALPTTNTGKDFQCVSRSPPARKNNSKIILTFKTTRQDVYYHTCMHAHVCAYTHTLVYTHAPTNRHRHTYTYFLILLSRATTLHTNTFTFHC